MKDSKNQGWFHSINLPNKLTILRIFFVPIFVAMLMLEVIPHNALLALIIFALASITDYLDGYLARTRMQVTQLGKFLDPIADKILVMSALVCFAGLGWIQAWTVVVILGRDFVVSAVRLAAVQSEEKRVIPARTSGKVKTAITMLTICSIMFLWVLADFGVINTQVQFTDAGGTTVIGHGYNAGVILIPISNALMYVCTALTVFSGVQYVWDARDLLKEVFRK